MIRFKFTFFLSLLVFSSVFSQQPTQIIRGLVIDNASNSPLPFVNIFLMDTNIGTTTDSLENFALNNVIVGR